MRTVLVQETLAEAVNQWRESATKLGTRFPKSRTSSNGPNRTWQ